MYLSIQVRLRLAAYSKVKNILKLLVFSFCFFPGIKTFAQNKSKVQEVVDGIKQCYYSDDHDYITDGERTVWVKSYKRWEPDDLIVLKKEAPGFLTFLNEAIKRQRYDVLKQLLPDYYNEHGGVNAFATDISRTYQHSDTDAIPNDH
jgi:hypothetical protein